MLDIYKAHLTELIYLIVICTSIYALFRIYFYMVFNKTKVYVSKTYQTVNDLLKFKIKSKELTDDNSVYLTEFKQNGINAYVLHILYGYYAYFKDPINLFCLLVAFGQIYEYKDFRSIVPLSIFGTLDMVKHMYSTSILLRQQNTTNSTKVKKLVMTKGKYKEKIVSQDKLKRGDFIKLTDSDEIPADILLINSKVAVQELELTGEDIVIHKTGLELLDSLNNYNITINHFNNYGFVGVLEDKQILSSDVENNYFGKPGKESKILLSNKDQSFTNLDKLANNDKIIINYSSKNMVYRGTKIIDGNVFGIIIETGNDCQIFRIDNNVQKSKTSIQNRIIDICLTNLYFMLLISSFASIIIYSKSISEGYSYQRLWRIVRKMILLFNTMVPLSLQFFFNTASVILSKRIEKKNNVIINRNGVTSFQINPEYIVSDKTGTITTNQMDVVGVYYNDDGKINNLMDETKTIPYKFLLNVIACSEVQPHSITKVLLKNDILEEKLMDYMLKNLNTQLITNGIEYENNNSYIEIQNIGKYKRLFYKPFDYKTEVKIGVINNCNEIVMHIQGTPESIDKYSNGGISKILNKLDTVTTPKNVYKRVIAHASKIINKYELEMLYENPESVLNNMTNTTVYVFYDYVIKDIDKSIGKLLSQGKDFTLLTGDKMSSAIEIGETIQIIKNNNVIAIDKIDDFDKINLSHDLGNICFVINGRMLEQIAGSSNITKLINIVKASNKKIIYRASPNGKQIYVACLQKYLKKEIMMVGDGANDVSAIIQANVGVGIKKGNNMNVQNISEICINDWNIIPDLLKDFSDKQIIINNIARWVLMKHMITASTMLTMLVMSNFENIRDPASPYLMALLNGSMYACMCIYTWYDNPVHSGKYVSFWKLILRGIVAGLINSIIVLSQYDINNGIYILIPIQAIQLIVQLYWKFSDISIYAKLFFVIMSLLWGIFIVL